MTLGRTTSRGYSLIELLIVLMAATTFVSVALPLTRTSTDAMRARHAAGFIASRFRLARHQAVAKTATVGVVFDEVNGRWQMRVCTDGNGNGLRRAEIAGGTDWCHEGPHDLETLFPGMRIAVDAALRGPAGEPPSADPVRFGASNIASFSASGSCTAGSLLLRSSQNVQYAVRVAGVTGRTRILRYSPAAGTWDER
jgi:prepilin-type N-terminal cleavage/methylation domain-containing protein